MNTKNSIFYMSILAVLIAAITFTGCKKEGPMGPAGADGVNGVDGKDANTVCLQCHTTANMDAKQLEYQMSKHFLGTSSSRNTKYCARCHTSEGFIEITGNGAFDAAAEITNATRINCKTCHQHNAFDFAGDTATYVLRATAPVSLNYDNHTKTTDFGKTNNLCVTCHQIRGATVTKYIDKDGKTQDFNQLPFFPLDLTIDPKTPVKYQVGQSFSVHDGNQSNLFKGINGYEYPGKTYTRTWNHSDNRCVDCHMTEYDPITKTGGHTLIVNKDACNKCHGSDVIGLVQKEVEEKVVELGKLLVERKVFYERTSSTGAVSYSALNSHDFYGTLLPNTESTTKYYTSFSSANSVSTTTGAITYVSQPKEAVDSQAALRIGREWTYGELGAAYNYGFIESELSKGAHNHKYAIELLQNSIDWLKANK